MNREDLGLLYLNAICISLFVVLVFIIILMSHCWRDDVLLMLPKK